MVKTEVSTEPSTTSPPSSSSKAQTVMDVKEEEDEVVEVKKEQETGGTTVTSVQQDAEAEAAADLSDFTKDLGQAFSPGSLFIASSNLLEKLFFFHW